MFPVLFFSCREFFSDSCLCYKIRKYFVCKPVVIAFFKASIISLREIVTNIVNYMYFLLCLILEASSL